MRIIKSQSGFLTYQKIFQQLMTDASVLVVWQLIPESGNRSILDSRINSIHFQSGTLMLKASAPNVNINLPLYGYAEDGPLIFKSQILNVSPDGISISIPPELRVLEDPEIMVIKGSIGQDLAEPWRVKRLREDFSRVISSEVVKIKSMAERSTRDQDLLNTEFGPIDPDKEDEIFAGQRESPRARPKFNKMVKLARFRGSGPEIFKLFDLSRGGMGFIVSDGTEFSKGEDIHILGFNDFELDDPLIGTIMSIRPIDGTKSEFKIGVKFSDGQD
jgi:hypothetical protein